MKGSTAKQPEKKYITVLEATVISRYNKDWYYDRMNDGTLPFSWVFLGPRKRLIDAEAHEAWIRSREIPAGSRLGNIKGGAMKK